MRDQLETISLWWNQCMQFYDFSCKLSGLGFSAEKWCDPKPVFCLAVVMERESSFLSTLWHFCCCRKDFEVCSSGLSCLSQVSAHLQGLESLFILPGMEVEQTDRQMALVESLEYVRGEINKAADDFTTWKTHLLTLDRQGGKNSCSTHAH